MNMTASLNGNLTSSKIKIDEFQILDYLILYPLIIFITLFVTSGLVIIQNATLDIPDSIFDNTLLQIDATIIFVFIFLYFQKEIFNTSTSKILNRVIFWTVTFKLFWIISPPDLFIFLTKKYEVYFSN